MIRQATLNDLEGIFHLYQHHSLDISRTVNNEYAAKIQRDGFLIALENKEKISERIQNNFLFKAYEENGRILGFINIAKEIYFPEDASNIKWLDEGLKNIYFHGDDSIVLHEIIVDQENKRKGIGRKLLESCMPELIESKYHHLFSIVALGPLTNCPSLVFHTRNGFERVCVTMPIDLFELKNYMSTLFHRDI